MNVLKSLVKQIKKYVLTKRNLAVVALLISLIYFSKASHYGVPTIKLNYFLTALSRNYLSEVYLSGSTLKFKGENSSWYQTDISLLSEKRLGKIMIEYPNVNFTRAENILTTFNRSSLLIYGMAFVVLIQFFRFLSGFHQVGFRENKKLVNPSVKFSNVCGLESAKQELKQIIEFLNNSEKFLNIGARIRRGILLFGPPGTGKTLLAKAK